MDGVYRSLFFLCIRLNRLVKRWKGRSVLLANIETWTNLIYTANGSLQYLSNIYEMFLYNKKIYNTEMLYTKI